MTLTKEDLEALAKTEAEIRALPSTEPAKADPFALFKQPARLDQTPEYQAAAAKAEKPTLRADCEAPVAIFRSCAGEERRCIACSLVMMMARIASIGSRETCPHGCGKSAADCLEYVGPVE